MREKIYEKFVLILMLCCAGGHMLFAQNTDQDKPLLSVKSFRYEMTDMTANLKESTVYDQNGDKCALIKIITTETGFYFSCGMMSPVKVEQKVGEIWVYVPYGIKHLKLQHAKLGTVDYPISIQIEKAKTYVMELTSAKVMMIVAPTVTQQWVVFNVEPKDALVELDGTILETYEGRAKQFVNFGDYTYSVSAPQYHSANGSVTVNDAGNKVEVNVRLEPAFGSLTIPANENLNGASIYVDNKLLEASSVESLRLDSGQHTIKIVKAKYKPYTSTFIVEDGKLMTLSPVLEANFNQYTISSLEGAEIWINGEKVGISPWRGDLTYGPCTIECKKEGHHSTSVAMHISPSTPLEIKVDNPVPIYGSLSIDSKPDGAAVLLDGKKVGETPLLLPNVIIGEHTVALSRNGYTETRRTINVDEGKVADVFLNLAEAKSESTANCYIVAPKNEVSFPTVKGNTTQSVGTVSSVLVLWESFGTEVKPRVGDVVKSVTYYNSTIKVIAGYKEGNAVVAAKNARGEILWSWHIWVCKDFDPLATAQVNNNDAGIMMDRNLGATSATPGDAGTCGLLYQWGRKDPFLGGSDHYTSAASTLSWPGTVSSSSSTGTIAYAVAQPTTFITYNSSNYDWYYTGSSFTDNTRWQTSDKTKGMYDPCPAGWRVPDGGVWSKAFGSSSYYSSGPWDDLNRGMNFGSGNGQSSNHQLGSAFTIWYPAAGYRNLDDGSLSPVGYYGFYWSCTPNDYYAYYLLVNNTGYVLPSYNYYRAYGLSVRCLSE